MRKRQARKILKQMARLLFEPTVVHRAETLRRVWRRAKRGEHGLFLVCQLRNDLFADAPVFILREDILRIRAAL
jgi:hypothetical protein